MTTKRAFTLIELLVVISIIALLIGILLPALAGARLAARKMEDGTRVRGIHQALVTYSNGNNNYYPGLPSDGGTTGQTLRIEDRHKALLDGAYYTGEYLVSPQDSGRQVWTAATGAGAAGTTGSGSASVTGSNYSYVFLQVPDQGQRRTEWAGTLNTEAPVVTSRDTKGTTPATGQASYWDDKKWQGPAAFNDNHAAWVSDKLMHTTRCGPMTFRDDDIWSNAIAAGTGTTNDNIYFVNSGN